MGTQWKQWQTLFFGAPKSLQMMTAATKLKNACSLQKSYDQPRQHIKKDITLPTKFCLVKAMVFSSSHVWMWELDYKESWLPRNLYFWTVVLEKTLESALDCKEIQSVHPKGDQSWVLIGKTDVEAETPILRPPDSKSWMHLKRPWCWERLKAGGEGDDRGWDSFIALLTPWTWVWVSSRSCWRTGKPGVLQSMGSQRVGHEWLTELNWTELSLPVRESDLINFLCVWNCILLIAPSVCLAIKNKREKQEKEEEEIFFMYTLIKGNASLWRVRAVIKQKLYLLLSFKYWILYLFD